MHSPNLWSYYIIELDEKHKLQGNLEKILKFLIKILQVFIFIFCFFRKFVTTNRALRNNTFSTIIFLLSGGGGTIPPFPPGYALVGTIFLKPIHTTYYQSLQFNPSWLQILSKKTLSRIVFSWTLGGMLLETSVSDLE